ncbi:hypothetical protein CRUP_018720 [Coryphaenoides rupestris]|nr:hypothetical protein CRUP_018720 [Coryphaenoides rupestris]
MAPRAVTNTSTKMRSLGALFVLLALAGTHTALSASLESNEKEKTSVEEDHVEDQIEFEAAQKNEEHVTHSDFQGRRSEGNSTSSYSSSRSEGNSTSSYSSSSSVMM